ncbi:hypothetical protein LMG29542_04831 [Paraburkholderia humisilvae]|uniref:Lipoprotein n=1 Tax=Paraburkholderia humisilvae TaxID=627669 RepID=A0A6J5ECT2_9BURK|nr:hypothetical protein LMG29542_04831 [Paraburkholderia humisilvae]
MKINLTTVPLITFVTMLCNIPAYAITCSTEKRDGDASTIASKASSAKSNGASAGKQHSKNCRQGKEEKTHGTSVSVWDYN